VNISQLFSLVKANPMVSFLITFTVTFVIWMYKENKTVIQNDNKFNFDFNQKKALQFGQLESAISLYIKRTNEKNEQKLVETLGNCSPYFSNDLRKIVRDYYKSYDLQTLYTVYSLVQVEIDKLHKEATDQFHDFKTKDFPSFLLRLYKPAVPILIMLASTVLVIVFFMMERQEPTVAGKISIFFSGFSIFLGATFLFLLITGLIDRSIKMKRDRIAIFLILLLNALSVVSVGFFEFATIGVVIQVIVVIVMFMYLSKRKVVLKV